MDDDDTKRDPATALPLERVEGTKSVLMRVFLRALIQHQGATDALGKAITSRSPRDVENAAVDAYSFLVAAFSVLRRIESMKIAAPEDVLTARFAIRTNQRALRDLLGRAEVHLCGHELPAVLEQLRACVVFAVRASALTDR